MLINDFVQLKSLTIEEEIEARLHFESDHSIFKGHFPDQPVVPGVCMVQIIKEVMEKAVNKSLKLEKASNIKFISLIDPQLFPQVDLKVKILSEEEGFKIRASLFEKDQIFFKFNGFFR